MGTHLQIQTSGRGPDLVLLHGWGMHSGVWQTVVERLGSHYRLHCVDLPGHGHNREHACPASLAELATVVAEQTSTRLEGEACWLGWSLGGMVAARVALARPQLVARLVLVATSLRFSQTEDWPDAVAIGVLDDFAASLCQDYRATLQRFLALQVSGEPHARETLRELKTRLLQLQEPRRAALEAGLAILRDTDLRSRAAALQQATLLIGGERDRLVSPAALQRNHALLPRSRLEVLPAAGHAPFISQPERFLQQLQEFLAA